MVFRNPGDRETNQAQQEGIDAGNLAQGRADREAEGWETGGLVEEAIRDWLATKREFTADDIQNEVILPMVERGEVAGRDTRVLGPYITRMRNDGLITDTGYTEPSKRRRAAPQRVWRTNRRTIMRKWRQWSSRNQREKVQRGINSTTEAIEANEERIRELQEKIEKATRENAEAQEDIDYVRRTGGYDRVRDLSELANRSRGVEIAVLFDTTPMSILQGERWSQEMIDEGRIEEAVEIQQKEGVQVGPEMRAVVFRKDPSQPEGWVRIYEHDFVMEDEQGLLGNLAWTEERYFRNGASAPSKWRSLEDDASSDGSGLRRIAQAIVDTDFYMIQQNPFTGDYGKIAQDMEFAPVDPMVIEFNEQYGFIRPTFGFNEDMPMGEDYAIMMQSPGILTEDGGARFVEEVMKISPQFDDWMNNFLSGLANGGLDINNFWATVGDAEREQIIELARRYESSVDNREAIEDFITKRYKKVIEAVIDDQDAQDYEAQVLSDGSLMEAVAEVVKTMTEDEAEEIGITIGGWGAGVPVYISTDTGQDVHSVDVFEFIQSDFAEKWGQENNVNFLNLLSDVRGNTIGRTAGFVMMRRGKERAERRTEDKSLIGIPQQKDFERTTKSSWDRRKMHAQKASLSRNIAGRKFVGSPRVFNRKNDARTIANQVRIRGFNARVIPAKGGFRIYFGSRKSS
jgi:ribose 5-phosphate isomerase RpiB